MKVRVDVAVTKDSTAYVLVGPCWRCGVQVINVFDAFPDRSPECRTCEKVHALDSDAAVKGEK